MTTTLLQTSTSRIPATDVLRLLLDDVLASVGADADRYSTGVPEGRALLDLATLARRAARALCVGPGTAVADRGGVEVQRELAAAARLLAEAAGSANGESWEIADLLVRAERLQVQLADMLATSRR